MLLTDALLYVVRKPIFSNTFALNINYLRRMNRLTLTGELVYSANVLNNCLQ